MRDGFLLVSGSLALERIYERLRMGEQSFDEGDVYRAIPIPM
jgi:hypothetical protein